MAIAVETQSTHSVGSGTSLSTTITVDGNANAVYVFIGGWGSYIAVDRITNATLGGVSPDETYDYPTDDGGEATLWVGVWYNPSSGSQSFSATKGGASDDGPTCIVAQLSGVDTTTGVRDSDSGSFPDVGASTANSFTLTTVSGDWVLKFDYGWYPGGSGTPGTTSGWTSIQFHDAGGGARARLSRIEATGTSVTVENEDPSYAGLLGIAIVPAATGGEINEVTLSDSLSVSDPSEPERERYRELLDEAAIDYSAETRRKRAVEIFNNVVFLVDSLSAEISQPTYAINEETLTDNLSVSDTIQAIRRLTEELLDTLNASDSQISLRIRNRDLTDSLATTDSAVLTKELYRELLDDITVGDFLAINRDIIWVVQDTLSITDTHVKRYQLYRTLLDTIETSDSLTVSTTGFVRRVLQEAINLADINELIRYRTREAADTLSLLDSSILSKIASRTIADSDLATSDSAIATIERGIVIIEQTLLDTILVTDAFTANDVTVVSRSLLDSVDVVDSTVLEFQLRDILSDITEVVDSAISLKSRFRVLADSFGVSDSISASVGSFISAVITDALELSDTISALKESHRVLTDYASVTDDYTALYFKDGVRIVIRNLLDAISVNDFATASKIYPAITFSIRHTVELLSIDHDIDKYRIRHTVERRS